MGEDGGVYNGKRLARFERTAEVAGSVLAWNSITTGPDDIIREAVGLNLGIAARLFKRVNIGLARPGINYRASTVACYCKAAGAVATLGITVLNTVYHYN